MSWREFLVHLAMVTLGILIALGLEQSVEAYRIIPIWRRARQNMLTEITDNKNELDAGLSRLDGLKKEREDDVKVIDRMLAHEHLTEMNMSLNFSGATLDSASWTTASTLGALAYMEYGTVKQLAEVYKKQDFYDRMQDEEVRSVQVGLGMMNIFGGPGKPPDVELRAIKRQLLHSHAGLVVLGKLGKQLDADYTRLLSKNQPSQPASR